VLERAGKITRWARYQAPSESLASGKALPAFGKIPDLFPVSRAQSSVMTIAIEANRFVASSGAQQAPEFRIAIVYETQPIGAAAMELCERLMTSFQNTFMFQVAAQSFTALEEESSFQQSLSAAAGADMIFVGSAGSLPASLLRWLEECIERRRGDAPVALVDMTADDSAGAAAVHRFLKEVAASHHLDLICKNALGRPAGTTVVRPVSHTSTTSVRHWGINE
jgi:hypothetical protein